MIATFREGCMFLSPVLMILPYNQFLLSTTLLITVNFKKLITFVN